MSKTNPITKASVMTIMSKRTLVPSTAKRTRLFIDSDGNDVPATHTDGTPMFSTRGETAGVQLNRRIFNLRANSQIAMANLRNREYFRNGCKAEVLGGSFTGIIGNEKVAVSHTADEWFSAYLNACQMSFGVLVPHPLVDKGILVRGAEIVANIDVITTPNGSLLTIDSSTISATAPESYGKTVFAADDLELTAEEIAALTAKTPAQIAAEAKAAAKLAGKAGVVKP